ncbi:MAG: right-handed parallel beta-helix repeat-containing protein, partial [Candidatus Methanomethyliaceae archaeon]
MDAVYWQGKIWVVLATTINGTNAVYAFSSADYGHTWTGPTRISQSGLAGVATPRIMLDGNTMRVAYFGPTGVYIASSTDGTTWTNTFVTESGDTDFDPALVKHNGLYYLFWAPAESSSLPHHWHQWIMMTTSADLDSWSEPKHVTAGGYGNTVWWDYWAEPASTPQGLILFYSPLNHGTTWGDSNLFMIKVDWNPANDHYEAIQPAIDAADENDEILVHSGTYNYKENVTINKPLSLIGGSSPVLDGSGLGGVGVTISAGNTELRGFTIENYITGVEVNIQQVEGFAINILNAQPNVLIVENAIQNNGTGVKITSGTGVQIIGNTISGNTADTGILVESAGGNEAHGNKIYNNGTGVKNEDQSAAFEAGCNWWGDPTGPNHEEHNPNGKGEKVEGDVTFGEDNREWWTSENGPCAYHYFLTMEAPYPQNGGTVQPSVGGPYPYATGTGAEVIATANPGFGFVEWQELVNGQWVSINGQATHTIMMDRDRTIRALFLPARYSLSVTKQPPDGGTVMVSPNPGADGKYAAGTTVTLTVTPAAGFQ